MASPPIEWVPGDPIWPRRFTYVESIAVGAGIVVPVLALLIPFFAVSAGSGYQLWSSLEPGLEISLAVFLASIPIWWLPRRWAVVRRVGISPNQLYLEYSFRKLESRWTRVRWKDSLRVEISRGFGTVQFLLTDRQAARIRAFFRPYEPLPSSVPRWSGTPPARSTR